MLLLTRIGIETHDPDLDLDPDLALAHALRFTGEAHPLLITNYTHRMHADYRYRYNVETRRISHEHDHWTRPDPSGTIWLTLAYRSNAMTPTSVGPQIEFVLSAH
jgi:hypothetical protein